MQITHKTFVIKAKTLFLSRILKLSGQYFATIKVIYYQY